MIARRGGLGSIGLASGWSNALVLIGLTAFYLATAPANHTESVDGFFYAAMIAEEPLTAAPHPRLLLWIALMRCLYLAGTLVDPGLDAYTLVAGVNAGFAALAVILLASLLRRSFGLGAQASWLGAILLGVTYGFWRYAAEVEVYAAAVLIMLGLLRHLFDAEDRTPADDWRAAVPLALAAGFGILVYQPVGILAGIAIPAHLLLARRLRWLFAYGAIAGGIVVSGYALAYWLSGGAGSVHPARFVVDPDVFAYEPLGLAMFVKMALAFGHDLVSTNWIFGIEPLVALAEVAVPHWIHDEEIYAARRAGPLVWAPLLTLPVLLAAAVAAGWTVARHAREVRLGPRGRLVLLWFLVHAAVMAHLSPAGWEGWIPALAPFVILVSLILIGPCAATGRWWAPWLLVAALGAHNAAAGIGVVIDEDADYYRERSAWLAEHAREGDLVVVSINQRHQDYLRYVLNADVVRLTEVGAPAVRMAVEATIDRGNRVFVFDELLAPPRPLAALQPEGLPEALALALDYRERALRRAAGDAGATFQILPAR